MVCRGSERLVLGGGGWRAVDNASGVQVDGGVRGVKGDVWGVCGVVWCVDASMSLSDERAWCGAAPGEWGRVHRACPHLSMLPGDRLQRGRRLGVRGVRQEPLHLLRITLQPLAAVVVALHRTKSGSDGGSCSAQVMHGAGRRRVVVGCGG